MANKRPNMNTLKASAEKYEIELPKGSVKAAVEFLHDHFIEKYDEDNLAECPMCSNECPDSATTCPFCGVQFEGEAVEKTEDKPKTKATKAKGGKGTKPRKKKGAAEEKEEHIVTPAQRKALKEHIDKIKRLRTSLAQNAFDIGSSLVEIHDQNLWKGMGFDSFWAFIAGELDISRSGAYKYMLVSREFSRDEFLKIGIKKGELIAAAPEQHRSTLMDAATKEGASHTALRSKLNELEGKGGGGDGKKLTLLGRVKEGEVDVPWLNKQGRPITRANVKNRHGLLQLTDEIEAVLIEKDDGLGLTASFRKIEAA